MVYLLPSQRVSPKVAYFKRASQQKKSNQTPRSSNQEYTLGSVRDSVYSLVWKHQSNGGKSTLAASNFSCEFFGYDYPIAKITSAEINRFSQDCYKKGNSGATINRKIAPLSVMLNWAFKMGMIDSVPYIQRYPESPARERYYSNHEVDRLIAGLSSFGNSQDRHEMHAIVLLAVDTGMRRGEILSLTPENIKVSDDGQPNWIVLRPADTKNSRARSIPMTPRVRNVIVQLLSDKILSDGSLRSERLFSLKAARVTYLWNKLCDKVGLGEDKEAVFHVLRHTFASRLAQRGVSLYEIQTLLGHSDISMTQRYAKLCPDNLQNAIKVLY